MAQNANDDAVANDRSSLLCVKESEAKFYYIHILTKLLNNL